MSELAIGVDDLEDDSPIDAWDRASLAACMFKGPADNAREHFLIAASCLYVCAPKHTTNAALAALSISAATSLCNGSNVRDAFGNAFADAGVSRAQADRARAHFLSLCFHLKHAAKPKRQR